MRSTYCFVIESAKAAQYFANDRRPRDDVFALGVWPQFIIVLQNSEAQPEFFALRWGTDSL
jgi:hypothetical protein